MTPPPTTQDALIYECERRAKEQEDSANGLNEYAQDKKKRYLEDAVFFRNVANALSSTPRGTQRRDKHWQELRRIWDALPKRSSCRDCADHDGTCPNNGYPCDPTDEVIARLTEPRGTQTGDSVTIPLAAWQFLMGQETLEGYGFGEKHKDRKGMFWWRSVIKKMATFALCEKIEERLK